MRENVVRAIDIKSVVSNSVLSLILGCLLTFIPISSLVSLIIVFIGLMMIITNGYNLYIKTSISERSSNDMLFDAIGALLGFLLLSNTSLVITIIVFIYLVIVPFINLYFVKFDNNMMIKELPKIIFGVVLLVSGFEVFNSLFKVIGIVILVASVIYLGVNYYFYKKSGVKIVK